MTDLYSHFIRWKTNLAVLDRTLSRLCANKEFKERRIITCMTEHLTFVLEVGQISQRAYAAIKTMKMLRQRTLWANGNHSTVKGDA